MRTDVVGVTDRLPSEIDKLANAASDGARGEPGEREGVNVPKTSLDGAPRTVLDDIGGASWGGPDRLGGPCGERDDEDWLSERDQQPRLTDSLLEPNIRPNMPLALLRIVCCQYCSARSDSL